MIGAGPSGLVAAKDLLQQGLDVVVFEKEQDGIGGVAKTSYDFTFTTSTPLSMFSDFRIPDLDKNPRFFTGKEYCEYLTSYASHFGVLQRIKFEKVKSIRRLSHLDWVLETCSETYCFNRIVVACGANQFSRRPEIHGFTGQYLHSVDFVSNTVPLDLRGKRVLVIGGGESASDLVRIISAEASSCCFSTRSGTGFIIPRWNGPKPSDMDTNRVYHMISRKCVCWVMWIRAWRRKVVRDFTVSRGCMDEILKNNAELMEEGLDGWHTYGTKNEGFVEAIAQHGARKLSGISHAKGHTVVFCDNSEEQFDVIVLCTGYKTSFPFLETYHKNIADDVTERFKLFKNVAHPDHADELFFVGFVRPSIGSVSIMTELQARWIAGICSGLIAIPSKHELEKVIEMDRNRFSIQFSRDGEKKPLRDFLVYIDEMASMIGCNLRLKQLFFSDPRLFISCLCGPITGCHFRLSGPNSNKNMARASILSYPFPPMFSLISSSLVLALTYTISVFHPSFSPVQISKESNTHGILPGHTNVDLSSFKLAKGYQRRTEAISVFSVIAGFLLLVFWILKIILRQ